MATTYNLYSGTTLLASNIHTGYIYPYIGTQDFFIKSVNSAGSQDSNIDSGTGIVKTLPGPITDFSATDTLTGQVDVTWTQADTGTPPATYNLYSRVALLVSNITSPYSYTYTGTQDFFIRAVNSKGYINSNIDSGTGL